MCERGRHDLTIKERDIQELFAFLQSRCASEGTTTHAKVSHWWPRPDKTVQHKGFEWLFCVHCFRIGVWHQFLLPFSSPPWYAQEVLHLASFLTPSTKSKMLRPYSRNSTDFEQPVRRHRNSHSMRRKVEDDEGKDSPKHSRDNSEDFKERSSIEAKDRENSSENKDREHKIRSSDEKHKEHREHRENKERSLREGKSEEFRDKSASYTPEDSKKADDERHTRHSHHSRRHSRHEEGESSPSSSKRVRSTSSGKASRSISRSRSRSRRREEAVEEVSTPTSSPPEKVCASLSPF